MPKGQFTAEIKTDVIDDGVVEKNTKEGVGEEQVQHLESNKGITCVKDTKDLEVPLCKAVFNSKAANPFEDQTPGGILTRQYLVSSYTVTPSSTASAINVFNILCTSSAIANALKTFAYIHADLEISIKVNGTFYHQGALMAAYVPDDLVVDYGTYDINRTMLSAFHPVILDYSTSDSATITAGWTLPLLYLSIATELTHHGRLWLAPLIPIDNTSGGGETIEVTVYGRLISPKVAGFVIPSSLRTQSKNMNKEQVKKTDQMTMASKPSDQIQSFFKPIINTVGSIADTVDGVAKLFGFADKPTIFKESMPMHWNVSKNLMTGVGADTCDQMSLYPGEKLKKRAVSPMCENSELTLAQLAMIPMLHAQFSFTPSATKFQIGVTPAFVGNAQTTVVGQTFLQPDFLSMVASIHELWRGGIKYLLMFHTNGFTTARFRVSYLYNAAATSLTVGGDIPSQIIEVKGTTKVDIMVPYLYPTIYRTFVDPEALTAIQSPSLYIECISLPTTGSGSDPHIDLVMWRAAAEDFQVSGPISSQLDISQITNSLSLRTQTSIRSEFSKRFGGLSCDCTQQLEQGFCTSETTGRISELLKRYATTDTFELEQNFSLFDTGLPVPYLWDRSMSELEGLALPFWQLISCFKYTRGGTRIFSVPAENTAGFIYFEGTPDVGRGVLFYDTQMNPVVNYEAPWVANVPYWPRDGIGYTNSAMRIRQAQIVSGSTQNLTSFADDTIVSFLRPPLLNRWTTLSIKKSDTSLKIVLGNKS